jgi:TatA/E family protein of Tat protein translocase
MFTGGFSLWHLLILAFIGLLVFGRRLPEVGRSLGKGITEFKKGLKDVSDEVTGPAEQAPPQQMGYNRQMPPGQGAPAQYQQQAQPYGAQPYQQQPLPPAQRPQPTARIEPQRPVQASPGVRVGRDDMID